MRQRQPLVSVIMPVHNAGVFLVEAIESILNQTYKNLELIIVDDASTDNSWEIIKDYQKLYPRKVKTFRVRKQTNSAGNAATNYGFQFAKGQFVARMDADDIAYPERLVKQVKYLQTHPKTILVGTQADVIDRLGNIIGKKSMPTSHKSIYREYGFIHPIIHPTVMYRRFLLPNQKQIYEDIFGINDDYYTFFRLLSYGKFANLSEVLHKYRVHGKNSSLSHLKETCLRTVRIRLEARKNFGYRLSFIACLIMLVQLVVAKLCPEKILEEIYPVLRGISPISSLTNHISIKQLWCKFKKVYAFDS